MSYSSLLESVEESARERERELAEKAERSIRDLRQEAQEQAERLRKKHLEHAVRTAAADRNKDLYLAKAQNKREAILAREDLFLRAFAQAEKDLHNIRSDPAYPAVFSSLAREAIGALSDPEIRIRIDPRDLDLSRTILETLAPGAEVIADLKTAGGLVAGNKTGDVSIANTVESRLMRAKETLRLEIHALLSGG